jgi:glycosyltransferase involved in cell wall biosynthesis
VRSVLSQTFSDFEIIVLVDGPDPASVKALSSIGDSRLRWTELRVSSGGNAARNMGSAMAKGEWVAFLDDDDEWLPEKLERQAALAADSKPDELLVIGCRFLVRTRDGDAIWPRRFPDEGESIGDYIYNRRSLFDGESAMNTSTLLMAKKMVDEIQFSPSVEKHQEIDFLLRASSSRKLRVKFAEEPLAIWNVDGNHVSINNNRNWVRSLEWIRGHRGRLGRKAYSGFLLISLASEARGQGAWDAFFPILREAILFGKPTAIQLFRFCCMWSMSRGLRQRIRFAIRERRRSSSKLEVQNVPG